MSARELRSYGRARITVVTGDAMVAKLVRRTGTPSKLWRGRWSRDIHAKVSALGTEWALGLHHYTLADLRGAVRDPLTDPSARRALNRHIRARRAQGDR